MLAIQLKRFEYDYERVCAIKFNDYFEFPRILDMEPYTGEENDHILLCSIPGNIETFIVYPSTGSLLSYMHTAAVFPYSLLY